MALMWSDYLWPLVQGIREGNGFGFAPTPGNAIRACAGGSFFINRRSRFKRQSAEFILYLLQKERQIELMKKGLCSPVRSVYDDPSVLAEVPYAEALKKSLDKRGVYCFEAGPDAEAIQNVITKWVQAVWKGDIDAAEGMHKATLEMQGEREKIFRKLERLPPA